MWNVVLVGLWTACVVCACHSRCLTAGKHNALLQTHLLPPGFFQHLWVILAVLDKPFWLAHTSPPAPAAVLLPLHISLSVLSLLPFPSLFPYCASSAPSRFSLLPLLLLALSFNCLCSFSYSSSTTTTTSSSFHLSFSLPSAAVSPSFCRSLSLPLHLDVTLCLHSYCLHSGRDGSGSLPDVWFLPPPLSPPLPGKSSLSPPLSFFSLH